ncbi:MAG: hypothetical protein ACRBN8_28770 [Nannocystales bacterium]
MTRRAAALCAFLAMLGCNQSSGVKVQIGESATKTPEPSGPVAIIVSVPAKRALADANAWLVDDGVTPLGTAVRKPGLAMVVHFVDDSRPILYNRLHRLTYHGHTAKFGEAFPVEAEDLIEFGVEPPADSVWVFGPLGPCSATVGQPWIGRPSTDVRVFEVSYALEGCGTEGRWAPVASAAVAMPVGVRWVEAEASADATLERAAAWEHPLGAFATPPESEAPTSVVAHARWVDASPRPAQALLTAVESSSEGRCGLESHRATLGWWREDGFEPLDVDWLDPADPPLLVGALSWGGETSALVFDDGLDGLLAVVPAEYPVMGGDDGDSDDDGEGEGEVEGPSTWTVRPLVAGRWSSLDRQGAALRVQPGC